MMMVSLECQYDSSPGEPTCNCVFHDFFHEADGKVHTASDDHTFGFFYVEFGIGLPGKRHSPGTR